MMKFANVIQPSLISASPSQKVIDVAKLPQLHLLMGVVNHLVKLSAKFSPEITDVLKKHNIFQHGYQGGGLDGNNSLKLLKNLEAL